ncbi:hypothetical protein EDB80DRAFT_709072 [Ilyonectria destructans]|nr:hypothetical protein EDB80DRAFT_709072 [Ilyonectria destructans]
MCLSGRSTPYVRRESHKTPRFVRGLPSCEARFNPMSHCTRDTRRYQSGFFSNYIATGYSIVYFVSIACFAGSTEISIVPPSASCNRPDLSAANPTMARPWTVCWLVTIIGVLGHSGVPKIIITTPLAE